MLPHSWPSGDTTDQACRRLSATKPLLSWWRAWQPRRCVTGLMVVGLLLGTLRSANAQTFGDAANRQLDSLCQHPNLIPNRPLRTICTVGGAPIPGTTQNVGSQTQSTPVEISQQQLKEVRTEEKHRTKGGASSDTVFADLGGGVSTFLVAGAATVRHRKNAFEDGYHATLPSVTVGADYRVNTQLAVGLAFHYFNWDGDFTSAGGFNVHSYAPLGYLNYAPFDRAFVDVVLGYARQNVSYSRLVQIVKDPDRGGTDSRYLVSADFHSQVLSAHLQTGYDFTVSPNDTFTIGPRLGLNVQHALLDDYQESSNTGLELRYRVPDQSAVQTSLGFKTAWALATSIGTVSPSVAVHWVHEFANGQRTLHAGFIHDPASQEFAFKTETPARDWARLDLGVSVLLSPQFLVFATASTVQGNANLESYGGTVGVRANC